MNRPLFVVPMTLVVTALWAAGQTLMKRAVNGSRGAAGLVSLILAIFSRLDFWAGIFVTGVGTVLWLVVLSRADLSYATPLASVATASLILLSSIVVLHEPVGVARLVGALVIALGVVLVARS